jgi:diguanylate cyclase (GGDEF)-like protein
MSKTGQANRRRIGYLTSDLAVPFERELLTHALKVAAELDVELVATCGGWSRQKGPETFAYDVMRRAKLDGYILCAHTVCVGMTSEEIAAFATSFAPGKVVIVGADVPGFRCHTVSDRAGAAALTHHLVVSHARRKFAIVRGPLGHSEADARLDGCLSALQSQDLTVHPDFVLVGDFDYESGRRAAERLLELTPGLADLDAVIFANDSMAIAALDVFARARVSVPRAVSIVGFDDIEMAHLARTPLTTVRQPLKAQIDSALEDLVEALGGATEPGLVQHRTRLVLRRSCGCALVTRERISSAPPPRPGDIRPLDEFQEYGEAIAADLTTTLKDSTLPRALSTEWATDLVETFVSRISGNDEGFIERIDATAHALVQQDEPLTPLREAVLLLRRQLIGLTGSSGVAADDLDDATAEALLTIGSVEALREAQRRRVLEAVAVDLASAAAAISAASSLRELGQLAYAVLQPLGISTCVPVLLDDTDDGGSVTIPFSYVNHQRDYKLPSPGGEVLVLPPGVAEHLLVVPMASQGVAMGYAIYDAKPGSFFLKTRLTLALGAALRSAVLQERLERAYGQIAQQALRDPLTGLWNRRYLEERLNEEAARSKRSHKPLSACVVDLDGFKQVNDQHGHAAGDRVLTFVAKALNRSVRANDVVSRLGGDEFVVLLTSSDRDQAVEVAGRIVAELNRKDRHRLVTASVGVATVDCDDVRPGLGRKLLLDADFALLEAKRRGKCQALHRDEMLSPASRK